MFVRNVCDGAHHCGLDNASVLSEACGQLEVSKTRSLELALVMWLMKVQRISGTIELWL